MRGAGVRGLGARGRALSMPFEVEAIPLLDEVVPAARAIGAVNTVVNEGGRLVGHNTDHAAVLTLVRTHALEPEISFMLRGSGGMARAIAHALVDAGLSQGVLVARNESTGRALARETGLRFAPEPGAERPRLLVNATPLGMTGPDADALAFDDAAIQAATFVLEAVAMPTVTPLVARARAAGCTVIDGGAILVLQAVEQFALYTGLRPTEAQIADAAAFARG